MLFRTFVPWLPWILEATNAKITFIKFSFRSRSTCDLVYTSRHYKRYLELKMKQRTCFYYSCCQWVLEKHSVSWSGSNNIPVFGPSLVCSWWEVSILEAKDAWPWINHYRWASWCLGFSWAVVLESALQHWVFDSPTFIFWQTYLFPWQASSKML